MKLKLVLFYFAENYNFFASFLYRFYSGILIELFRCENIYHQAVEVTAGNRLFYHVVDDDRIAMKILKEVNF